MFGVIVATSQRDLKADVIASVIKDRRSEMVLIGGCVVGVDEVSHLLAKQTDYERIAVILVGSVEELRETALQYLQLRPGLVVLQVNVVGKGISISLQDVKLNQLLHALRTLVQSDGSEMSRIAQVQLRSDENVSNQATTSTPFLDTCLRWLTEVYKAAINELPENGDAHGFSLSRDTTLQLLSGTSSTQTTISEEKRLHAEFTSSQATEPLLLAARRFCLSFVELKFLLLALSPELDACYQRCIGFLLDDMSRRVGTSALYCKLLGNPTDVRSELARRSQLKRWRVFEVEPTFADDPLRLDPHLIQWLLGDANGLYLDPDMIQLVRSQQWAGSQLLADLDATQSTAKFIQCDVEPSAWHVLVGEPKDWKALVEVGCLERGRTPIRIEVQALEGHAKYALKDRAIKVARLVRLTRRPIVIDAEHIDDADSEKLQLFLQAYTELNSGGTLIAQKAEPIVRVLGGRGFEIAPNPPINESARCSALLQAASIAGVYLDVERASRLLATYPLTLDRMELAASLAASRTPSYDTNSLAIERFTKACRDISVEGISHLAERIEPVFEIQDIVLPEDQSRQLIEITQHVRLASKVLDGWRLGKHLPYGRGVTALFFGPSGTGKTMAAMGIAHELGVQLLRIDLSRVVNKYIGETEKNIDRAFNDAERSGAAILIDEADALLGKRSEVKDAHDRYANIEVAYLLQRMEAYEGLAILTSNMRQNLDAAFLRRIRFMVSFPRPDAAAREQIWRFCLPAESHELNDRAFRLLARSIELTGGHIRQMSLRAAFLAAAADVQIQIEHVVEAARAEYAKLGLPPIDIDLGRQAA